MKDEMYIPFPKIYRYSREVIVTEKIDGTNGCIDISETGKVKAGSRTRWITPENDNYGFAAWVAKNQEYLVTTLGPGRHFGEWWGAGIQRRYNMPHKVFSVFNVTRFADLPTVDGELRKVPTLWRGNMDQLNPTHWLNALRVAGSAVAPGFANPEGIVIHHVQSGYSFKKTLDKDDAHKGEA